MPEDFRDRRRGLEPVKPTEMLVDELVDLVSPTEDFIKTADDFIAQERAQLIPDDVAGAAYLDQCATAIAEVRRYMREAQMVIAGRNAPDAEVRRRVSACMRELEDAIEIAKDLISPSHEGDLPHS